MPSAKTLQILNILTLIFVIVMNALAVTLPFGGNSQVELAKIYPSLFTPAGFTFSIWSLIYIGLIGFIIVQSKGLFNNNIAAPDYVNTIGPWFIINGLANGIWLLVWHNKLLVLSVMVMLVILISLLIIYTRLDIGNRPVSGTERWLVHLPFSIYLGWISVATIANLSIYLSQATSLEAFGSTANILMVVMLAVVVLLGLFMAFRNRDFGFVSVLVWAFYGILAKRQANDTAEFIITAIIAGMVVLAVLVVIAFIRRQRLA